MTDDLRLDESLEGDEGPLTPSAPSQARHGKGVGIWFVIGLLTTAAAVFYIVLDGADDAVFAYTVEEAIEKNAQLDGKTFKVSGKVVPGSIVNVPGTLDTTFKIAHGDGVMTIKYDQALPDTFKDHAQVIAEGELKGDQLFARQIIAKCPSKYEEEGVDPSKVGETPAY
jgi:cytochrome c-type biogenesis protein CcmE